LKKLLLILLCLPLLFTTCKKEDPVITINNAWQLSMQCTYLAHGGENYQAGLYYDTINNQYYQGLIQLASLDPIMIINDTIFPGVSTSYSSRVWSINENQVITDTYYDENGFSYNISQHSFTRNLDTIVVNFQAGDIQTFVINKLTAYQFHITSIPERNYIPLFDINGIYQDTVLVNLTYDKYFFYKAQ
jgi:hypothetical protein